MLEPRRLAAKAAAQRLASEFGESVGERVGYSVRLESCTSAATRLEVLTDGLFLRRLQADPGLAGVDYLIFDEFHERGPTPTWPWPWCARPANCSGLI